MEFTESGSRLNLKKCSVRHFKYDVNNNFEIADRTLKRHRKCAQKQI